MVNVDVLEAICVEMNVELQDTEVKAVAVVEALALTTEVEGGLEEREGLLLRVQVDVPVIELLGVTVGVSLFGVTVDNSAMDTAAVTEGLSVMVGLESGLDQAERLLLPV